MTDCTSLRAGYSFNQNPIVDAQSSANVASPVIIEHAVYLGASYHVTEALSLSLAYIHCFQNSIDGFAQFDRLQTEHGAATLQARNREQVFD